MPSEAYLILRSAHKACPRLELGARLEGRTTVMQPFVSILSHALPPGHKNTLAGPDDDLGETTARPIRRLRATADRLSRHRCTQARAGPGRYADRGRGLGGAFQARV